MPFIQESAQCTTLAAETLNKWDGGHKMGGVVWEGELPLPVNPFLSNGSHGCHPENMGANVCNLV